MRDEIPFAVRQIRCVTHPQLLWNCSHKYNNVNGKSFPIFQTGS
jgi:hypothetical protein